MRQSLGTPAETDASLFDAIRKNDALLVRAALDNGARVNARGPNGRTPLHYAATLADSAIATLLLQNNANPDTADDDGLSPLHEAVIHKKFAVADALIAGGADINFQSGKKVAVIHSAFFEDLRHDETLRSEYMVRKGVDLSITMQRGMGEWTVYEIAREQACKFPFAATILGAMMRCEKEGLAQAESTPEAPAEVAEGSAVKLRPAPRNRYKL